MKIKSKLLKILNEGEGHTIWKVEPVLKALEDSGIEVEHKDKYFEVRVDGLIRHLYITGAPKGKPKSKYDIVSWAGTQKDIGIWDNDLVKSIVDLTGKEYSGRDCMGRGFQYRAYLEWLTQEGVI